MGTADYSIPSSNVIYLAINGSDSNPGTQALPKATLPSAMSAVTAGGTIVVRAGEYRQSQPNVSSKSFTLQNYPGEVVWFDGSDPIGGWTHDAASGLWWAQSTIKWPNTDPEGLAGPLNPLAMHGDMMFYDGNPLWQVASSPTSGQFMTDYGNDKVWIADDPTGHEIRITKRDRFLLLTGTDVTVRGIGVRRYASPTWGGTIQVADAGKRARFENLHIYDSSSLSLDTDDAVVTRCTVIRASRLAFGGNIGSDCEWSNNLVDQANWKILQYHTASSLKIVKHTRPKIAHNIFRNARSPAMDIWLDISCYDPVIVGNLIENCAKNGIFIELTEKGIIANNYVYGDSTASITTAGMVSYNSGTQQYWNNYIENFRAYLIEIGGDTRRNAVSQVSGDGVGWEMMPWYAQNITICNNVLGPNLQYFQIGGQPSGVDMASAFVKIRGNLSYGNSTGGTSHSGLFRWYDSTVTSILKTWTAAEMAHPGLGFADNALTATLHPTSVEAAALAPSIGEPLPADVAAVLGVPVGIKAVGPILPAPIPA